MVLCLDTMCGFLHCFLRVGGKACKILVSWQLLTVFDYLHVHLLGMQHLS